MFIISATFSQTVAARDEVCVYTKKDYEGEEFCTSRSVPNLDDYDLNDKISSLSVRGNATAVLHKNADYRGKSIEYSGDVSRIGGGMDDQASSLQVYTGGAAPSSEGNAAGNTQYPASAGWQLQAYCSCSTGKRCYVRKRNGQTEVGACVFECPSGCK
jgi:hypothetical protein